MGSAAPYSNADYKGYQEGDAQMKTILRSYRLYTSDDKERAAYETIVAKMKARGTKCFRALGESSHCYYYAFASGADGAAVELETKHLFDNQWNTAPIPDVSDSGLRVFDWAEYAAEAAGLSRHFKCGHYLEITDEMTAARNARGKCGYCGKQYTTPYPAICEACIDSEYLSEDYIKKGATRIYPVTGGLGNWRPLSSDELDALLPKWKEAQIHGATERGKARVAKERDSLAKEYARAVNNAETKFNGFTWLMDRGLNTSNVIFYEHTGKFSIGWREGIAESLRADWTKQLDGFPFPWEFAKAR
jgi:hypothetical protein